MGVWNGTGWTGMQVVCFFCMFSRREVLRFVFGALDPSMRGYLGENDFQVCRWRGGKWEGDRYRE